MRITQVRDDGKVNTMRTLKIERLVEQMKKETKAQPVSNMREVLPYMLPGDKNDYIEKVPKILPAAVFVRENGVMAMSEYNGIVMLQVNGLSGHMEADEVKERVKELPQTYLAFIGSSGKSVKIWVRFTYPDNRLPDNREQAEVFHAHAYRLAVKYYQPQLPFDIELREPSLEQYCRLTFDPELYFNPEAMPVYLKQPASLPGETTYREQVQAEVSPLQRLVPGYDSYEALSVLFEAAFARALDEQKGYRPGDDIHSLLICLAEQCFRAGIPQEDTVRWARGHYRLPKDEFLIRETVKNVYNTCGGFADKSSLLPEQLFVMQTDEFMKRRYEFRFNQLTSCVEYRERNSFNFYFRPIDKRVMASITMNAMYEGIKLWDKDVVRYLNSDHVPVYHPVEEFLYDLPRWDGKDHIRDLAERVPCDNPHWGQLFRRWFLSTVAHWRGVDKNHANSTSPILIGPQAYRKSTFCRLILPPCLQAYYTDSIDFGRKRDAELYLNRFLLINMDEFDQTEATLRVVMGPQDGMFSKQGIQTFLGSEYTVTNEFDRMGCRLEGPFIAPKETSDIISDGIAFGAIQVPSHGKPIILLADRQTTGGYGKIATVASVDIPKLVQRKTDDKIHFKAITVQEAQALYVEEMKELDGLRKIIHQPCKEVLDCRLVAKRLRKLFEE